MQGRKKGSVHSKFLSFSLFFLRERERSKQKVGEPENERKPENFLQFAKKQRKCE
jgi:hypothetical protein